MNKLQRHIALALLSLATLPVAAQQTPKPIALRAGHVLDVKTGKLLSDQTLVIEDGKIVSIGASARRRCPADATRVDLPNCHRAARTDRCPHPSDLRSQFGYDQPRHFQAARGAHRRQECADHPAGGLHHRTQRRRHGYSDVALRDAINAGDVPGPRMLVSGPPLGITGGHCDNNLLPYEYHATGDGVADGIAAVQHKVRENIKYGADLIKICATGGVLSKGDDPQASQYTLEEMKAIVADAHRLGRKVAAHAHGAQGILWAIEAGVDSIEHGPYIDDAGIAAMKKNGTYLVPTLYLMDWMLENAKRPMPAPSRQSERWSCPSRAQNITQPLPAG